jgi:hypothetical protein
MPSVGRKKKRFIRELLLKGLPTRDE